jgi:intracellular septation protein
MDKDAMMREAPPWLKPTVDFGPLAVFLVAYETKGMLVATAALMGATAVALTLSLLIARRVPLMPLVTAIVVGIFGGLTLWLNDDTFIKLKPTILYGLFAAVVGGGLATGKLVLKRLLGDALPLDDEGWKRLSQRFLVFFLAMALANELVRRSVSTDLWVLWKVPGSIILSFAFILAQFRLIQRHRLPDDASGA